MITTSIVNLKGGTGKTTTAANMATILAEDYGKKVLLIDADAQANSTALFLSGQDGNNDLTCLMKEGGYVDDFLYDTAYKNLSILPASINLNDLDLSTAQNGGEQGYLSALIDFCAALADDGEFDHVIIDCPPGFTVACIAALISSDEIIVPIKLDKFAVTGVRYLLQQVVGLSNSYPKLSIRGGLLTAYYNSPNNHAAANILRGMSGIPLFNQVIRRSPKADESTWADEPVCQFSPQSAAGLDYRKFVAEYLGVEV